MKLYLSGPMTGIENFNFPFFNEVSRALRSQGYEVINPAETDIAGDKPREFYMRKDIASVLDVGMVVVLPGWETSRGAQMEVAVARAIGTPVAPIEHFNSNFGIAAGVDENAYLPPQEPLPATIPAREETIIEEAQRLVNGDRNAAYGHPLDDYKRTAAMWSGLLGDKLTGPITAEEAILCMVALKLSREIHRPKRDNLVDAHGYLLCYDNATRERARRLGET